MTDEARKLIAGMRALRAGSEVLRLADLAEQALDRVEKLEALEPEMQIESANKWHQRAEAAEAKVEKLEKVVEMLSQHLDCEDGDECTHPEIRDACRSWELRAALKALEAPIGQEAKMGSQDDD